MSLLPSRCLPKIRADEPDFWFEHWLEYNRFVAAGGLFMFLIQAFAGELMILSAPFLIVGYGIAANAAYLLGPIVQLVVPRNLRPGYRWWAFHLGIALPVLFGPVLLLLARA